MSCGNGTSARVARTERGLLRSLIQRIALQTLVLEQPVAGIEHLLGVHRGSENRTDELVGIKGDGRHQLLQRIPVPRKPGSLRARGRQPAPSWPSARLPP